jgi:hypothetical protein
MTDSQEQQKMFGTPPPNLFEALFVNSSDPQLLSLEDGSVQFANDSACELFSFNRDQLHQISIEGLFTPSISVSEALSQLRHHHTPNAGGGISKFSPFVIDAIQRRPEPHLAHFNTSIRNTRFINSAKL